jgi:hypothetical protein
VACAPFSALAQLCWSNVCFLSAEIVEQLELEDDPAFLDQLTTLRPQLQEELDLAEAAALAAEAEAPSESEGGPMASEKPRSPPSRSSSPTSEISLESDTASEDGWIATLGPELLDAAAKGDAAEVTHLTTTAPTSPPQAQPPPPPRISA